MDQCATLTLAVWDLLDRCGVPRRGAPHQGERANEREQQGSEVGVHAASATDAVECSSGREIAPDALLTAGGDIFSGCITRTASSSSSGGVASSASGRRAGALPPAVPSRTCSRSRAVMPRTCCGRTPRWGPGCPACSSRRHGVRGGKGPRRIDPRRLILVAVEGDWPDTYRVNRYVRGQSDDIDATERWWAFGVSRPGCGATASWSSSSAAGLQRHAAARSDQDRLLGLDHDSLRTSMKAVLRFLAKADRGGTAGASALCLLRPFRRGRAGFSSKLLAWLIGAATNDPAPTPGRAGAAPDARREHRVMTALEKCPGDSAELRW